MDEPRSGWERDDHDVAGELATEAGRLLVRLRAGGGDVERGHLRAEGDRQSNDLLLRRLAALRPGDIVLSEEAADDPARLHATRVWIVDPLDGTAEFSQGRADWAVHVALVVEGTLTVGAVVLPSMSLTLSTRPAPVVPPADDGHRLRIAVSRSRPPDFTTALSERLDAELVPMGSAGFKAMAVVRGDVDVYVHAGGQYEWDSAAPAAVALAAGLHASRLDGSPLRYNQPDPWLPDLLICRPELAGIVVEAVSAGT